MTTRTSREVKPAARRWLRYAGMVAGGFLLFYLVLLINGVATASAFINLPIPTINPLDWIPGGNNNPLGSITEGLIKAPAEVAADAAGDAISGALNTFIDGLFKTVAKYYVAVLAFVIQTPNFFAKTSSGGAAYSDLMKMLGITQAIGLAVVASISTLAVISSWMGGMGRGGFGIEGLLRSIGAACMIGVWPALAKALISISTALNGALLSNSFMGPGVKNLITEAAAAGALSFLPGAMILNFCMGILMALVMIALIAVKIALILIIGIVIVAMPLALAVWPLEQAAYIAESAGKLFLGALITPVMWAIALGVGGAVGGFARTTAEIQTSTGATEAIAKGLLNVLLEPMYLVVLGMVLLAIPRWLWKQAGPYSKDGAVRSAAFVAFAASKVGGVVASGGTAAPAVAAGSAAAGAATQSAGAAVGGGARMGGSAVAGGGRAGAAAPTGTANATATPNTAGTAGGSGRAESQAAESTKVAGGGSESESATRPMEPVSQADSEVGGGGETDVPAGGEPSEQSAPQAPEPASQGAGGEALSSEESAAARAGIQSQPSPSDQELQSAVGEISGTREFQEAMSKMPSADAPNTAATAAAQQEAAEKLMHTSGQLSEQAGGANSGSSGATGGQSGPQSQPEPTYDQPGRPDTTGSAPATEQPSAPGSPTVGGGNGSSSGTADVSVTTQSAGGSEVGSQGAPSIGVGSQGLGGDGPSSQSGGSNGSAGSNFADNGDRSAGNPMASTPTSQSGADVRGSVVSAEPAQASAFASVAKAASEPGGPQRIQAMLTHQPKVVPGPDKGNSS